MTRATGFSFKEINWSALDIPSVRARISCQRQERAMLLKNANITVVCARRSLAPLLVYSHSLLGAFPHL